MKRLKNPTYHELAWTEHIVAPPKNYVAETEILCKAIKDYSEIKTNTLLHLGCGAGVQDYTFKKHFKVTGIDISKQMLLQAKKLNPEITYLQGDMRTFHLKERFDAVAIPDSIGYMTTFAELRKTIQKSHKHLNSGGVLLIVAHTKEEFQENNFVYSGSKDDVEITVFENNRILKTDDSIYEATIVHLVRRKDKLKIINDCHRIGLFGLQTWLDLFNEFGFEIKQTELKDNYDSFIVGDGMYWQTMFICRKVFQKSN